MIIDIMTVCVLDEKPRQRLSLVCVTKIESELSYCANALFS